MGTYLRISAVDQSVAAVAELTGFATTATGFGGGHRIRSLSNGRHPPAGKRQRTTRVRGCVDRVFTFRRKQGTSQGNGHIVTQPPTAGLSG